MQRSKAISKVRKLLALANRHPDTPEASNAKSAAQSLITEFRLGERDLEELASLDTVEIATTIKTAHHWRYRLLLFMARQAGLDIYLAKRSSGKNGLRIVGPVTIANAIKELYCPLARKIGRARRHAMSNYHTREPKWGQAFGNGALRVVRGRLTTLLEGKTKKSTALVQCGQDEDQIRKHMQERVLPAATVTQVKQVLYGKVHVDAFQYGMQFGYTLRLKPAALVLSGLKPN